MKKIDRRKHYILVLDTETANTLQEENGHLNMNDVLVYDCGFAVCDTHGNVYETRSLVNEDIFAYEWALMRSAYYAAKIPQYLIEIKEGKREMVDFYTMRKIILSTMQKYNIKEVAAHNARFDYRALNNTQRYCTKSRYRYFFPFGGVTIWDTMKMAQDVICKKPSYKAFCREHGFLCKNGAVRKTAEVLYRYISDNPRFEERHTGLEDVLVEKEILAYCFKQHKPMRKKLWEDDKDYPPMTDFQFNLLYSIKENPTIRL